MDLIPDTLGGRCGEYIRGRDRMTQIAYQEALPEPNVYFSLFEATGWNDTFRTSSTELKKAIGESWAAVSAYDENQLVGFGRVVSDGVLYAFITDLIVQPSHQGKGIGSEILRRLIDRCQTAGIRQIQLFSAAGKVDFYRKRGFVERPPNAPGMRWIRK